MLRPQQAGSERTAGLSQVNVIALGIRQGFYKVFTSSADVLAV